MKKCFLCILLFFYCACGHAEQLDMNPVYEFAKEYGAGEVVRQVYECALQGKEGAWSELADWLKCEIAEPVERVAQTSAGMIAPILMLVLHQGCFPSGANSDAGLRFLLRMLLLLLFSDLAFLAFESADVCIRSSKRFADTVSPGIAGILTAMGMSGTAVLVTPAAALIGGISEDIFLRIGMPLCKISMCLAIAGNLSNTVHFERLTNLCRKTANWGAGLFSMLFTTMIGMQADISELIDRAGVRTVKFAVDSAAPVIGNGVSDAWEGLVSGLLVTKNALGMSGIAVLIAAGFKPLILCVAVMLVLHLAAALLDIFGEKETSVAAVQMGNICQMALSLATASLVITAVLLGAAMAVGKGFLN